MFSNLSKVVSHPHLLTAYCHLRHLSQVIFGAETPPEEVTAYIWILPAFSPHSFGILMRVLYNRPVSLTVRRVISQSSRQLHNTSSPTSFQQWRTTQRCNMATPTKIHLSTSDTGVVKFKEQDEETAKVTSELLQKNHDVLLSCGLQDEPIDH